MDTKNVYKEAPNEGQKTISTCWVVSPKVIDDVMSTQACLVARRFTEKENQTIRSDTPTCLWESASLFFLVAVSYELNVGSIDIKWASLQEYKIDRRDIYVKSPKEANSDKLWKLQMVIYCLWDASRAWYLWVNEKFQKLGAKVSKYDKAFYIWIQNNKLVGIIVVHVVDFIWAGSKEFCSKVIENLRLVFKISKENTSAFKYISRNVRTTKNTVFIDQKGYKEILTTNHNYHSM